MKFSGAVIVTAIAIPRISPTLRAEQDSGLFPGGLENARRDRGRINGDRRVSRHLRQRLNRADGERSPLRDV